MEPADHNLAQAAKKAGKNRFWFGACVGRTECDHTFVARDHKSPESFWLRQITAPETPLGTVSGRDRATKLFMHVDQRSIRQDKHEVP
ncbi:hypothetical protein [Dinoroseobacter sp. S76]|uniref:hypothetical protein n=1 Tax=Dinoroseobacter sp. S76 TaxID=3415124 RepID=UPI003C7CE3C5